MDIGELFKDLAGPVMTVAGVATANPWLAAAGAGLSTASAGLDARERAKDARDAENDFYAEKFAKYDLPMWEMNRDKLIAQRDDILSLIHI